MCASVVRPTVEQNESYPVNISALSVEHLKIFFNPRIPNRLLAGSANVHTSKSQ